MFHVSTKLPFTEGDAQQVKNTTTTTTNGTWVKKKQQMHDSAWMAHDKVFI